MFAKFSSIFMLIVNISVTRAGIIFRIISIKVNIENFGEGIEN